MEVRLDQPCHHPVAAASPNLGRHIDLADDPQRIHPAAEVFIAAFIAALQPRPATPPTLARRLIID